MLKNERWKYNDLSFLQQHSFAAASSFTINKAQINHYRLQQPCILLVLVNGVFSVECSDISLLPKGMIVCGMQKAREVHQSLIEYYSLNTLPLAQHPFAERNISQLQDGLFIWLPENCELIQPLHVLCIQQGQESFITQPQHLIVLEKNASLTLVEEYRAATDTHYFMNSVSRVVLKENAKFQKVKLQHESAKATHFAYTYVQQAKQSTTDFIHYANGGHVSRDDIHVALQDIGAQCKTAGFYELTRDQQEIDFHIDIDHVASQTESEMLFKGVADKKSRAIFNGRLHVHKGAQKIKAYQANHNILLSNHAEAYSKPELEIYADDVKCKHGSTVGQLNQDALFYLRSRGMCEETARKMLLSGFAEEIMMRMPAAIRKEKECLHAE